MLWPDSIDIVDVYILLPYTWFTILEPSKNSTHKLKQPKIIQGTKVFCLKDTQVKLRKQNTFAPSVWRQPSDFGKKPSPAAR